MLKVMLDTSIIIASLIKNPFSHHYKISESTSWVKVNNIALETINYYSQATAIAIQCIPSPK